MYNVQTSCYTGKIHCFKNIHIIMMQMTLHVNTGQIEKSEGVLKYMKSEYSDSRRL